MTYADRFKTFKPQLQEAFVKMVLGVNVEITRELRDSSKYYSDSGKWFFITAINENEEITIQNNQHQEFSGLNYKDLKLKNQ